MVDGLTPAGRSALMSRIRGKGTRPERAVFAAMRRIGLKFSRHDKSLPGSPDAVFPHDRVAVFVEGDFWHGWHFNRWKGKLSSYWREKIERNRRRDKMNAQRLRRHGWRVLRVWEHDVKSDLDSCIRELVRLLSRDSYLGPRSASGRRRCAR